MIINIEKFGKIKEENNIVNIITNSYERLMPHDVKILDLLLFETLSDMRNFFFKECRTLGIISEDFGEQFFASHDAWRGTPRISVCLENMKKLPKKIQINALRHEVGHSILHGSLEYYVFPIPSKLIEISKFGLPQKYSFNLAYLLSIAVKDYEVTKLLLKGNFIDEQIAYSKYIMRTSNEDLVAWRLSINKPSAIAICLAGRLKDLACLIALYNNLDESFLNKIIKTELGYFPNKILKKFLIFVEKLPHILSSDTIKNFNIVVEEFFKDLLEPLLNEKDPNSLQ